MTVSPWARRACYWFGLFEFGSYELRKIVHPDGAPVKPAYSDYVAYMADVAAGESVIKCPSSVSPVSMRKDIYDHSWY